MIIISQDGNEQINFDNVNKLFINDRSVNSIRIAAEFTNGKVSIIGTFTDAKYGKEVFQDLMKDYRGNAVIEVPKDRR